MILRHRRHQHRFGRIGERMLSPTVVVSIRRLLLLISALALLLQLVVVGVHGTDTDPAQHHHQDATTTSVLLYDSSPSYENEEDHSSHSNHNRGHGIRITDETTSWGTTIGNDHHEDASTTNRERKILSSSSSSSSTFVESASSVLFKSLQTPDTMEDDRQLGHRHNRRRHRNRRHDRHRRIRVAARHDVLSPGHGEPGFENDSANQTDERTTGTRRIGSMATGNRLPSTGTVGAVANEGTSLPTMKNGNIRDLKGSSKSSAAKKRKYSANPNGGNSNRMGPGCEVFYIEIRKDDIVAGQVTLDNGYVLEADVYEYATSSASGNTSPRDQFLNNFQGITGKAGKKAGVWYETISFTDPKPNFRGEFFGRRGSGTILVAFNKNTAVSMAAALSQDQYPVTGGSGQYARCPGGFAQKFRETPTAVVVQFQICFTC